MLMPVTAVAAVSIVANVASVVGVSCVDAGVPAIAVVKNATYRNN